MSTARQRRRRNRLFKENPYCYYCGILVVNSKNKKKKKLQLPDNTATLEHLRSRFDALRYKNDLEIKTVLACLRCNRERGFKECLEHNKINRNLLDRKETEVCYE